MSQAHATSDPAQQVSNTNHQHFPQRRRRHGGFLLLNFKSRALALALALAFASAFFVNTADAHFTLVGSREQLALPTSNERFWPIANAGTLRGLKNCLEYPAARAPRLLAAGDTVSLPFEAGNAAYHVGRCDAALHDAAGALVVANVGTQADCVATPAHAMTIVVPSVECVGCVLRVRVAAAHLGPDPATFEYYDSCVDVSISNTGASAKAQTLVAASATATASAAFPPPPMQASAPAPDILFLTAASPPPLAAAPSLPSTTASASVSDNTTGGQLISALSAAKDTLGTSTDPNYCDAGRKFQNGAYLCTTDGLSFFRCVSGAWVPFKSAAGVKCTTQNGIYSASAISTPSASLEE